MQASRMQNMVMIVLLSVIAPVSCAPAPAGDNAVELDLRPLEFAPEPVGELHPNLSWMKEQKIRGIWIGNGLYEPYAGRYETVGHVLKDAGFNLAAISVGLDPKGKSTSIGMEHAMPLNVAEARRVGLHCMAIWKYGSTHVEPYRRYREPNGRLHQKTCCPLDGGYIERHIGRWAVATARTGADGFVMDTEMYGSDESGYYGGPCTCDDCFVDYLNRYAKNSKSVHDDISREGRGKWLYEHDALAHYGRALALRVDAQYDSIRQRCQEINPAFFFGIAPTLGHLPGLERGLGTSAVPCLVFSEPEYHQGPTTYSYKSMRTIKRGQIPVLYLPGLWILKHSPEALTDHALTSSLHYDGWWVWYGTALLYYVGTDNPTAFNDPYGRFEGASSKDYFDLITAMHNRLEKLLTVSKDKWPQRKEHPSTSSADVVRRKGSITIDGELDESAWEKATPLDMTRDRYGNKTDLTTEAWMCWDDQALYIAAKCPLPEGAELNVPERGRDNVKIGAGDCIEIFIDPKKSQTQYVQFMVSAMGDIYDSWMSPTLGGGVECEDNWSIAGKPSWNAEADVATTHDKAHYVIEMRIPFKNLAETPEVGQQWSANICRSAPHMQTWSPTGGIYHVPERFGTLRFVGK